MTGDDFLKAQLALAAYVRGHESGITGMLAVAFVVRNRVKANGRDWMVEIDQDLEHYKAAPIPDVRNPLLQQLLHHIDAIFDGTAPDKLTSGATHIGLDTGAASAPGWERISTIGTLTLFRKTANPV